MYGVFKMATNNSAPQLIATCRTKMGAQSACRHFYDIYTEERNQIPYKISYHRIQSYTQVRLNYYILRIVRGMEASKLERLKNAEQKATNRRTSQEKIVASLY